MEEKRIYSEDEYINDLCNLEGMNIYKSLIEKYKGINLNQVKIISGSLLDAITLFVRDFIRKEDRKEFMNSFFDYQDENTSADES